jgi:hypothetical protein
MKAFAYLAAALMLIVPADARNKGGNKQQNQRNKAEEAQKKKEKEERDNKREAIEKVLDAKDTNHDSSLTRDEYLAGEADAAAAGKRFDQFNKNKDRYLSKSEIGASLGQ